MGTVRVFVFRWVPDVAPSPVADPQSPPPPRVIFFFDNAVLFSLHVCQAWGYIAGWRVVPAPEGAPRDPSH